MKTDKERLQEIFHKVENREILSPDEYELL